MEQTIQKTSYRPSHLATIFHSFPHLNVSLHLVNNTFAPDSELYLESLGILGSIPAGCLILTLFLLLVYLMTRCCDRKPRPKHSILVLKWTLAIFAMLCFGAVAVNLFGNDDFHTAMLAIVVASRAVSDKINSIKNQTKVMNYSLNNTMKTLAENVKEIIDGPVGNQTARGIVLSAYNTFMNKKDDALKQLHDISRPLKYINLGPAVSIFHLAEAIRWPATMTVYCMLLVFLIILLFGIAKHSRFALIMFSVVGLFAIIISWLLGSVYLSILVATGDFCVNPDLFMEHKAPVTLQTDILIYYISCNNTQQNPFTQPLHEGKNFFDEMSKQWHTVSRIAKDLFGNSSVDHLQALAKEVYNTNLMLTTLSPELDCNFFRTKYMEILHYLCHKGMIGLSLMLLSSLVSGFFFTILVWLDSHTWIYIRKKRDVSANGGGGTGTLRPAGIHPIGTISHQRLGSESGQYATLNRKFRTLDHPSRGRHMVSFDTASHTLGHGHSKKPQRGDGPGQYSTLSKKCKTLESSDFY